MGRRVKSICARLVGQTVNKEGAGHSIEGEGQEVMGGLPCEEVSSLQRGILSH